MDPSVSFFCPCSEKVPLNVKDVSSLELTSFPTTIKDHHTLHLLSYLNYCESCQALKCRKCMELEVVTKYCPRCMAEMKPEHSFCSKNCMDCPICGSNVIVNLVKQSRNFQLKCSIKECGWKWETGQLDKPRSLARVVRKRINEDEKMKMFSDLERSYIQRKQLYNSNIPKEIPKEIVLRFEELKLKKEAKYHDIKEFIYNSSIQKFDPASDIHDMHQRESLTSNSSIIPYTQALRSPLENFDKSTALPLSTILKTKTSKRCKACRTSLMKPDVDPTSVKFYKLSNAIDFLPTMKVYPYPNESQISDGSHFAIKSLLCFQNPLEVPMTVTISSSSSIPSPFNHRIHLPVTTIKLGSRPDSHNKLEILLKTIPTIELSKSTRSARLELMNRPQPVANEEEIYEKGVNYTIIPLKVDVKEEFNEGTLKVPLLVTVKSDVVNCGFWIMLDLGAIQKKQDLEGPQKANT